MIRKQTTDSTQNQNMEVVQVCVRGNVQWKLSIQISKLPHLFSLAKSHLQATNITSMALYHKNACRYLRLFS